ncbi:MAG TPA: bifunctional precorrin-2 dehydrogenase/sirohydrochlorin ferrochelatase, partial [Terriglobia bacterium]|nr:bifunctional precorrin-2 dehydrogenase/sirohydrochlorin ferrochelatase [Terriglobia bacterium]
RRGFTPSDMDSASLVVSATDDSATQQEVVSIARAKGVLINTVDKPELCDFIVPAILRRGDVTLAISTSGKSPALAANLRERLDRVLTDEVARAANALGAVRHEVHERFADAEERKRVFESIVNSGIVEWIGECDDATALQRVRRIIDGIE